MASPRPPHSAWLRCQHQASHAIKQLTPFINLTPRYVWEGEAAETGEGNQEHLGRETCWAERERNASVPVSFVDFFEWLYSDSEWHHVCFDPNIYQSLWGWGWKAAAANAHLGKIKKKNIGINSNWFLKLKHFKDWRSTVAAPQIQIVKPHIQMKNIRDMPESITAGSDSRKYTENITSHTFSLLWTTIY